MADRTGLRGVLFSALTGNRGDVSGKGQDVKGMLLAVGGPSRRTRSGIDLTAAADKLGVTRRTVERWLRSGQPGGQRPSQHHAKALAKAARQAATTRAGRKAGVAGLRSKVARSTAGVRLSIGGTQGPTAQGRTYTRPRLTQLDLDQQDALAMLDAYERGGDKGFMSWATQHWGQEYLDDWAFQSVDEVRVEGVNRGAWQDW